MEFLNNELNQVIILIVFTAVLFVYTYSWFELHHEMILGCVILIHVWLWVSRESNTVFTTTF